MTEVVVWQILKWECWPEQTASRELLFGNGERTGNVDIVTLGMNMYSQGVDPKLDFSDMPHICEVYERCTGMTVGERSPYSGALVFAAFLRFPSGCNCQRYALDRGKRSEPLDSSVSAN